MAGSGHRLEAGAKRFLLLAAVWLVLSDGRIDYLPLGLPACLLVTLLGEKQEGLKVAPVGPTVILLAGLQGSGKTTTAAKLAKRLSREGRQPLLAALGVRYT